MADFIIIAVLAVIIFFILRSQLGRLRKGQCAGGCAGCAGCGSCGNCGSHKSCASDSSRDASEKKAV